MQWTKEKEPTMIYTTLHIKLQIERKEPYHESDVNSIPREGLANVAPVV
jgi:hypothetical protein